MSEAPPIEREASGSPLKGGIKQPSYFNKIKNEYRMSNKKLRMMKDYYRILKSLDHLNRAVKGR